MSFLKQIQKSRNNLKNVSTVVTYADGRSFIENQQGNFQVGQTFGFVIDTKPDNIPAKVTENIYLGCQDCCELETLSKFNIKYVLSIGVEPFPPVNVTHKFVKCFDLPETNIVTILQNECMDFINNAVRIKESILIHCNAGVSRSSAIVIGYLMLVNKLSYADAFSAVREKRPCIKPNCGFEAQLRSLEF